MGTLLSTSRTPSSVPNIAVDRVGVTGSIGAQNPENRTDRVGGHPCLVSLDPAETAGMAVKGPGVKSSVVVLNAGASRSWIRPLGRIYRRGAAPHQGTAREN